ncbi:MAG: uracil-DNA glycosylase [Deltaproteobacteria bacterium]|nr:uracil-DNA glycosylase [Deltaproteobacteria bacterium]
MNPLPNKILEYLKFQQALNLLPSFFWKENDSFRTQPNKESDTITRGENALSKTKSLPDIHKLIGDCKRCRLSEGRSNIVFGVGNPEAELMFVGEAPGRDEDLKAEPFVGRAGQLLTKIIEAMGFTRKDIYIANVVKCRPPENRNPAPDEISICSPFLFQQIETINPKVIVCLGTFAAQTLLATEEKIKTLRGKFHPWPNSVVQKVLGVKIPLEKIQLMPTYHPAFLLRNPNMKKPVWEDMQKVMGVLRTSP